MNLAPSDFPRLAGAVSLSKPDFDILMAISTARQAASPTVGLLESIAIRELQSANRAARRALFGRSGTERTYNMPRPVRFFDLSEETSVLPENVNSLFTRGFQPMLSPSPLDRLSSAHPLSGEEDME